MNCIKWKVSSDEFGEYWESYLNGYRFRIALPCVRKSVNKINRCLLYIDREDENNNTFIRLEENSLDSFLEAIDIAERVYSIINETRPHALAVKAK